MEVIIIRKLLSLFLVLVVITSFSVTAFAAGEQPSGSNYQYNDYGTVTGYDTYWTASNKNLQYIGNQTRYSNTYLSAIQSLVSDIKLAVDPSSSPAYSTPSGQNYNYYSFSDVLLTSNFWDAVNLQLQYISNRINSIKSSQATISSNVSSMGSSVSSIATSSSSIDGKLPTGYYPYVTSDGTTVGIANSTWSYWRSVTNSLALVGSDIESIRVNLPSGFYSWMSNSSSVSAANSNRSFWSAVSDSLMYIGSDIQNMRLDLQNLVLDVDDLHTMFASPEDLALKADQENNISAATSNFLSGSDSATSVGTGSIGKVKDLGDDAAAWFDTGVQATSLFDALSNDDTDDGPWMWFTQATMDDLDSTSSNRSFKSSPSPGEYVPDLYGAKMDELDRMLHAFSE
ncbi:MAG: hypothetical protein J6S49_09395 [Erysipelotrichaceae bacterium]|nr:hypothetical protein [Erysipelotrichaceae bacterium]